MYRYLLFFIFSFSFAQNPFSKEHPSNVLALKACGYVNLLDGGFGSILGSEKSFLKNHSVGVKLINNYFLPRSEFVLDNNGVEHDIGDYTDDKDFSLIVEYKYYVEFLNGREISPYFSISYKTGKRTIDNDRDFPHDYYHRETKYNFFGSAVGTLIFLSDSKKWTIDTQLGYLFGKKNRFTEYVVPMQFNKNESFRANLFRFEIMVAYNINW